MSWFTKKKKSCPALTPEATAEIEATKEAQNQAFNENFETGKNLTDLLVENHFTIKIYVATGGKTKTKRIVK